MRTAPASDGETTCSTEDRPEATSVLGGRCDSKNWSIQVWRCSGGSGLQQCIDDNQDRAGWSCCVLSEREHLKGETSRPGFCGIVLGNYVHWVLYEPLHRAPLSFMPCKDDHQLEAPSNQLQQPARKRQRQVQAAYSLYKEKAYRRSIEDVLRVILILDGDEFVIVLAIEVLLPIGIAVVAFREVCGPSGRNLSKPRRQFVRDHFECILHRLQGDFVAPGRDDEKRDQCLAPARVDSVVGGVVRGGRSIQADADHRGAVLVQEAEGVYHALAVVQDDVPREESPCVDVGIDG